MFEDFCDSISTSIEERMLHWNGCNSITCTQALRLVECGYMLGGFIVDFNGYPQFPILFPTTLLLTPQTVFFCRALLQKKNRIDTWQGLIRDNYRLNNFYSNYKSAYENCEDDYNKLVDLKRRIEMDLYEHSKCIIRETREFGG